METLLEGLFKDIITKSFFTETQVRGKDNMGEFTNKTESTASIAVKNLISRSGFYDSIKEKLLDRLITVIDSGEMDEVLAKSTGEYLKSSLGSKSWDRPTFVDAIQRNIP